MGKVSCDAEVKMEYNLKLNFSLFTFRHVEHFIILKVNKQGLCLQKAALVLMSSTEYDA